MEACKEASLIVVILAMVPAAILRVLQPTKRTSPCLFFPMKAVPCHCLFFAATFAMRMMSCHSCGNWICFLVRGGWIGMCCLVDAPACTYSAKIELLELPQDGMGPNEEILGGLEFRQRDTKNQVSSVLVIELPNCISFPSSISLID
uniref:Uncharacterized protein n=1 Tax=Fagus sylvatica TaxID=28930 RepID=A0A2N9IE42_FAGSY